MVRGLYTAGTGMMVQRSKMDVVTNNIVNAETTGFKQDNFSSRSFADVLLERINDPYVLAQRAMVGPFNFGTHIDSVYTEFAQGNLEPTAFQTDIAIAGDGFFVIETQAGERYSRSGNFVVNNQGFLVTQGGDYVLGENGRVNVGTGEFSVDGQGYVAIDGVAQDRLRIVQFADNAALRKTGDNLYQGGAAAPAENYTLIQYCQENSNVDIASEMVDMLTLYRIYEVNQKVLSMTDETVGMAVKIGSLR